MKSSRTRETLQKSRDKEKLTFFATITSNYFNCIRHGVLGFSQLDRLQQLVKLGMLVLLQDMGNIIPCEELGVLNQLPLQGRAKVLGRFDLLEQ